MSFVFSTLLHWAWGAPTGSIRDRILGNTELDEMQSSCVPSKEVCSHEKQCRSSNLIFFFQNALLPLIKK